MKLKNLKTDLKKIKGRLVFLRVDFNVPIVNGKIKEDFKIKQVLKTINFLLENDCQFIIASHLGKPQGVYEAQYSLAPVHKKLELLLKTRIKFLDYQDNSDFKVIRSNLAKFRQEGFRIFLLDNLRFFPREERDCKRLGRSFASLAEIYVNEAFAVSHRANSSVSAIKNFLPSYAGLLLEEELKNLNKILKPQKPLIAIIGGAKISTKIPIIKKIYSQSSNILVGGALANNFFKAQGLEVGRSLISEEEVDLARKFLTYEKIILPLDVLVENQTAKGKGVQAKKLSELNSNDLILDIGPQTIKLFSKYIKEAKTLVWNGPLGKFEDKRFQAGTMGIARALALRSGKSALAVVGGGETVEALNLSGLSSRITWISTGGGAMLAYLSGEKMPGL